MGRPLTVPARRAVAALAVLALAAGACSGGPVTGGDGTPPVQAARHVPQPAGPTPSTSAKMICTAEVQSELQYALGVKPVQPVRPSWADHVYACRYVYSHGVLALSVKELSSVAGTTAYYDAYKARLGDTGALTGLGQGAFVTRDGSIVVRKDYKVLLVDVSGLPARFGSPATSAGDVAITVADIVMACWNGD